MANADDRSAAGLSVTAILCTYNRCESLAATLEGLAASQLPESVEKSSQRQKLVLRQESTSALSDAFSIPRAPQNHSFPELSRRAEVR